MRRLGNGGALDFIEQWNAGNLAFDSLLLGRNLTTVYRVNSIFGANSLLAVFCTGFSLLLYCISCRSDSETIEGHFWVVPIVGCVFGLFFWIAWLVEALGALWALFLTAVVCTCATLLGNRSFLEYAAG